MADGWRAVGRLAGAAAQTALDHLGLLPTGGLPRTLDGLDRAWAEAALRPTHPGLRIQAWRRLDVHSGTTTRARFALEASGAEALPPTLFAKVTPAAWPQRIFGHVMGLGAMEVRFYQELATALPVRVPAVHFAAHAPRGPRFVLLLEDVAARGARFVTVGERVDAVTARAVVEGLAALHAPFWETPRFHTDLSWLRSLENRGRDLPLERALTARMVGAAAQRFGAGQPQAFASARRLVCERRDALEAAWAQGARTLVHGDCHIGNLFFEDGVPGFLDWQVVARAPGVRDVSYFLCNSLPSALREAEQEELLRVYRAALLGRGVAAPSEEVLWQQYRQFALYGWLSAAFTAGAGGLQEDRIARAGLERATACIASLHSVEAFDEIGTS